MILQEAKGQAPLVFLCNRVLLFLFEYEPNVRFIYYFIP